MSHALGFWPCEAFACIGSRISADKNESIEPAHSPLKSDQIVGRRRFILSFVHSFILSFFLSFFFPELLTPGDLALDVRQRNWCSR